MAELRRDRRINTPIGVGVLVKAPKAGQDHRIDLPVIGPPTVEAAAVQAWPAWRSLPARRWSPSRNASLPRPDRAKVFVIGVNADGTDR